MEPTPFLLSSSPLFLLSCLTFTAHLITRWSQITGSGQTEGGGKTQSPIKSALLLLMVVVVVVGVAIPRRGSHLVSAVEKPFYVFADIVPPVYFKLHI